MKPLLVTGTMIAALLLGPNLARATNERVVYSFKGPTDNGNDGEYPQAGLINLGGTLYGTTTVGGTDNDGTVFKVTRAGAETVVYSFEIGGTDGVIPQASLTDVGGSLYGTTQEGGAGGGNGTVFKVTKAGAETVIYAFKGGTDGMDPAAGLINVGGTLYGTTETGGASGFGTVFKVTKAGAETVLYSFKGFTDGAYPLAGLINVGGTLYGTTFEGGSGNCGAGGCGTVFRVTKAGAETIVYSLKGGSDGAYPEAGVTDVGGKLYGTTVNGGGTNCSNYKGCGTVFNVTRDGVETVVYAFKGGTDGANPTAGLINMGGTLYGTTYSGGAVDNGTVFKVTMVGAETVLHSFRNGSDGASPFAGLIELGGRLYGTTVNGGASGFGTVFKVTP